LCGKNPTVRGPQSPKEPPKRDVNPKAKSPSPVV